MTQSKTFVPLCFLSLIKNLFIVIMFGLEIVLLKFTDNKILSAYKTQEKNCYLTCVVYKLYNPLKYPKIICIGNGRDIPT